MASIDGDAYTIKVSITNGGGELNIEQELIACKRCLLYFSEIVGTVPQQIELLDHIAMVTQAQPEAKA